MLSSPLLADLEKLDAILGTVHRDAVAHLLDLADRPAGVESQTPELEPLPTSGKGTQQTFEEFKARFASGFSGSPGPRYFGFVTGGVTPAALAGDWLTSVYDQNALGSDESSAPHIEIEAIGMLRDLFGLSRAHAGTFVTGATMSNFVGLATGRQWVGKQHGVNIAQQGLHAAPPVKVLSGAPHSTIFKALTMSGLGRDCVELVPCLPDRESIDVSQLAQRLSEFDQPSIIVANAGTVNTVDFDDIQAILDLRDRHSFWLHVDGAFGGFAACSPNYAHFVAGLEQADSITIDAHKYLNVPYDAAMQFTRHLDLQAEIFANAATYIEAATSPTSFVHLTPESSRRLRALPAWFTLMAYGRIGYQGIVEHTSTLARKFADKIIESEQFRLLAPVRLNGICFTFDMPTNMLSLDLVQQYLDILKRDGRVFLTPTSYLGVPAIRISITNWRTTAADIDIAWEALQSAWAQLV